MMQVDAKRGDAGRSADLRARAAPPLAPDVERSIPEVFAAQVARGAERCALRWSEHATVHALSYGELDRAANAVAEVLSRCASGAAAPTPVGVLIGRGGAQLAAALGALKAGRPYVPLDAAQPPLRLAELVGHAQMEVVLTDREHATLAAHITGAARTRVAVIAVDALEPRATQPARAVAPSAPAYLMYTSGSTGEPKGVVHSHRNVLADALGWAAVAHLGDDDRVACLHAFSVAASTPGIFGTLLSGGTLLPFEVREDGLAAIAPRLAAEDVTVLCSFTTLFRRLLARFEHVAPPPRLRLVRLGGERLFPSDVALARARLPGGAVILNAYGATEVHAIGGHFIARDTPVGDELVPIGFPLPGIELSLVDADGREVERGAIGEIVVRSPWVALGYWGQPELGRATFVDVADRPGVRAYRTGDLGRQAPDGCLTHLGRADEQVKVRGVRVEPGEIEGALLAHPALAEAVVVARDPDGADGARLAAYVVAKAGAAAPDARELRRFLRARLPDAMVPPDVLVLAHLPLLPGGKVDRRALPAPVADARPREPGARPRNPLELQIAEVWEAVLGVAEVGVDEQFYDLGGTSLAAVDMIGRLRELLGRDVPLAAFSACPTIERLAAGLVDASATAPSTWTTLREGDPARAPLFFLHGDPGGGGLYCHNLFRAIARDRTIHLLHPPALDADVTIEDVAARFVPVVRALCPEGPYVFGGACNGGVFAFELARQMCLHGALVRAVIVIDARLRARPIERLAAALRPRAGERRRDAWSRVARRLWRAVEHLATSRAGPTAAPPPTGHHVYFARYDGALARYEPPRYPGRVTLIRCAATLAEPATAIDPTRGFGRCAAHVDLRTVPGDHGTMLTRHAPALAVAIDEALRASEGAG